MDCESIRKAMEGCTQVYHLAASGKTRDVVQNYQNFFSLSLSNGNSSSVKVGQPLLFGASDNQRTEEELPLAGDSIAAIDGAFLEARKFKV